MGRPDIEAGAGAGLEVWTGTPGSLATLPEAFPNHWERWAPVSEVTPEAMALLKRGPGWQHHCMEDSTNTKQEEY